MNFPDDAACQGMDTDTFYPEPEEDATPALDACSACPVKSQCLEYALERGEEFGVWGGTTEAERASIILYRRKEEEYRAEYAARKAARKGG